MSWRGRILEVRKRKQEETLKKDPVSSRSGRTWDEETETNGLGKKGNQTEESSVPCRIGVFLGPATRRIATSQNSLSITATKWHLLFNASLYGPKASSPSSYFYLSSMSIVIVPLVVVVGSIGPVTDEDSNGQVGHVARSKKKIYILFSILYSAISLGWIGR